MKTENRRIIIVSLTIFTLFYPVLVMAQMNYASEKLSRIGSQLPDKCLRSGNSRVNCPEVIEGKSIIIRYDDRKNIAHLGINLFQDQTKEMAGYSACEFIERIILELTLYSDNKAIVRELKNNNMVFQRNKINFGSGSFGSISLFTQRTGADTPFFLHRTPTTYTAIWKPDQTETFTLSFPAERELVSGKNKKEADEELNGLLNKKICPQDILLDTVFSSSGLKFLSGKNIYEKKGKYYVNESINANVYYIKQADNLFCILNDENFPRESISNQFLGYAENKNLKLHISHIGYGALLPEIDISLKDFICHFKGEFNLYCAVQKKDENDFNITLVLKNNYLNYVHMLSAKTAGQDIFAENGSLKAELYSYIPQHNFKTPLQ